jgi:hypothetical protein
MSGDRARPTRPRRCGVRRARRCVPGLVRTTDRLEDLAAWLLVSLALLAAVGAVLVGHAVYGQSVAGGTAGHTIAVRAVLLADVPPVPTDAPSPQSVPAVWTDAEGAEHIVELLVTTPLAAGTEVTARVDRHGQVVPSPSGQPAGAAALGVGAGLATVALVWALLATTWMAVRRATGRRNAAAWAQGWALVEPEWSRR